ncbi:MAG: hypothetical protein QXI37_01970 [Thermoprotei archaeon]
MAVTDPSVGVPAWEAFDMGNSGVEQGNPQFNPVIEVTVEGLCEPVEPGGVGAYAFEIASGSETLESGSGILEPGPSSSSLTCRYIALVRALTWLMSRGYQFRPVRVLSCSTLFVNRLSGRWDTHEGNASYRRYLDAVNMAGRFTSLDYRNVDHSMCTDLYELCCRRYEEYCLAHLRPVAYKF